MLKLWHFLGLSNILRASLRIKKASLAPGVLAHGVRLAYLRTRGASGRKKNVKKDDLGPVVSQDLNP